MAARQLKETVKTTKKSVDWPRYLMAVFLLPLSSSSYLGLYHERQSWLKNIHLKRSLDNVQMSVMLESVYDSPRMQDYSNGTK